MFLRNTHYVRLIMIACPSCHCPNLAKHGAALGSPIAPATCTHCGQQFHARHFWIMLPLFIVVPVGAFVVTLLAVAVISDFTATTLALAAIAPVIVAALLYVQVRRDKPTRTTRRDKV